MRITNGPQRHLNERDSITLLSGVREVVAALEMVCHCKLVFVVMSWLGEHYCSALGEHFSLAYNSSSPLGAASATLLSRPSQAWCWPCTSETS